MAYAIENTEADYVKLHELLLGMTSGEVAEITVKTEEGDEQSFLYLIMLLETLKREKINVRLSIEIAAKQCEQSPVLHEVGDATKGRVATFLKGYGHLLANRLLFYRENSGLNKQPLKPLHYYGSQPVVRLLPLLPVNNELYGYLAGSVENALSSYVDRDADGKKRFNFSKSNLDSSVLSIDEITAYCIKSLTRSKVAHTGLKNVQELLQNRITLFESYIFFKKMRSLPMMAMLIFCLYDTAWLFDGFDEIKEKAEQKGRTKYTDENLQKYGLKLSDEAFWQYVDDTLINTLDMTDGLLQLIENVVFYAGSNEDAADGKGYLSFRIFGAERERTESYNALKKKFKYYFEGYNEQDYKRVQTDERQGYTSAQLLEQSERQRAIEERREKRKSILHFLEVGLVDMSGKNMCDNFVEKHKGKPYFTFKPDEFSLRTFFAPEAEEQQCWNDFNNDEDNVLFHYGLQLFDALIKSLDGCFIARSFGAGMSPSDKNSYTTSGDKLGDAEDKTAFAGTQYRILLPFLKNEARENPYLNTEFSHSSKSVGLTVLNNENFLNAVESVSYRNQREKEHCIEDLWNKIIHPNSNEIYEFNVEALKPRNAELFAKAVMKFVARNREIGVYIAVTNCAEEVFKSLARWFAIFYNRSGENKLMENSQIYLCCKIAGLEQVPDEFIIAGANLKSTLTAQLKLDAARGISREHQAGTFKMLMDMLERRPGWETESERKIEFVPFDLFLKDENGKTVFDYYTNFVINKNVQSENMGCKVKPTHMRIGSKIHVDAFFEVPTLFKNNYYTARFAWLLKERLRELRPEPPTEEKPFLFIGYELSSEMMLQNLCELYEPGTADYCVLEFGKRDMGGKITKDRFRHEPAPQYAKNYIPVYIIPISTTISTLNKLEANFKRKKGDKIRLDEGIGPFYFTIIQTLPNDMNTPLAKTYFDIKENTHEGSKYIISKIIQKDVNDKYQKEHYLFRASMKWLDPLNCEKCYPKDGNFLMEEPIIETDKTSSSPMQLYGTKDEGVKTDYASKTETVERIESPGSIFDLKDCMRYGHYERNSNHYEYYIETEKLFEAVKDKTEMQEWLKKLKEQQMRQKTKSLSYDIVIYPIHYSNAGFTNLVNKEVFEGTALVIGVDYGKEFRENFKTHHIDIFNLYRNLVNRNCGAEINFHYIDDTIVHGSSYARVKSLARSLFPRDAFKPGKVKINLFKTVTLLLNRNSDSSIANYVDELGNYRSFLSLRVSSLHTTDYSCVLCQEKTTADFLVKRSALSKTIRNYLDETNDLSPKSVLDSDTEDKEREKNYKGFLKLVAVHELETALLDSGNNRAKALGIIAEKINAALSDGNLSQYGIDIPSLKYDVLISYIKAMTTPFVSYKKSFREAVFILLNAIFDFTLRREAYFLNGASQKNEKINNIIKVWVDSIPDEKVENIDSLSDSVWRTMLATHEAVNKSEKHDDFIKEIMKVSVRLKSNFIMRLSNMKALLKMALEKDFLDADFLDHYLYQIKYLTASNTDAAKILFLEYLLLNGAECLTDEKFLTDRAVNFEPERDLCIRLYRQIELELNLPQQSNNRASILIKDWLHNLYIENSQLIYDAASDLRKNNETQSASTDYYLQNFVTMQNLNDQDPTKINAYLQKLSPVGAGNEINLHSSVEEYFNDLAKKIEGVIRASLNVESSQAVDVYFLGEREDKYLYWDDAVGSCGNVYSETRTVQDMFANNVITKGSEEEEKQQKKAERCVIKIGDFITAQATKDKMSETGGLNGNGYIYSVDGDECLAVIKFGNYSNDAGTMSFENVLLAISIDGDYSEYKLVRALRYIFAIRKEIEDVIREYFKGGRLFHDLRIAAVNAQMSKVRANDHIGDNGANNSYNPRVYAEGIFFHSPERTEQEEAGKPEVYGFQVKTIMGRMNIKVLSENMSNMYHRYRNFFDNAGLLNKLSVHLSTVAFLPCRQQIELVLDGANRPLDEEYMRKTLMDYFEGVLFKDRELRRDNDGKLPSFPYLTAIFAELISSAAVGELNSERKNVVGLDVNDDGYLEVTNCTKGRGEGLGLKIKKALKREDDGISLATTCGYFDMIYGNDGEVEENKKTSKTRVRISIDPVGKLSVGIPLFKERT